MVRHLPGPVKGVVFAILERLLSRGHGAIYRALAIGNRLVFLEIGTTVSHFVDSFGPHADDAPSPTFDTYWSEAEAFLDHLARLDSSWVVADRPDPRTLRAGMEAYHAALSENNDQAKAELVLLGNLLLGAYEQTRVDTYLTATLSFFTLSWLHRIMRGPKRGFVALFGRGLAAPVSTLYALFATRFFLVIELPEGPGSISLKVGRPIPGVGGDGPLDLPRRPSPGGRSRASGRPDLL